ncbi:class I SAM-dependent methyltransferase [Brevundimonas sp. TWP2-3-2]|uniref:class I SAM-dependent methyltransferase n=1 Tax=unclassified Brevundimonas TaxID=2622653 RepID=UPI003CF8B9F8
MSFWTEIDLEHVTECPMCCSPVRMRPFSEIKDWSFGSNSQAWSFEKCVECSSLYLNPRPTASTIMRAYVSYYTHGDLVQKFNGIGSAVNRLAKKGYLSRRFGYACSLIEALFGLLYFYLPNRRLSADLEVRHLPAPRSANDTVLDIGSGSGEFLRLANSLGYHATGLEPDTAALDSTFYAVENVRESSLPNTNLEDNTFNQITLHHVFEHLHYPIESIEECFRILKPGGRLWMAMPNPKAFGLQIFREHWRGLEAPRHLVLPSMHILQQRLSMAGFKNIQFLKHPNVGEFIVRESRVQENIAAPTALRKITNERITNVRVAKYIDQIGRRWPNHAEMFIVIAFKCPYLNDKRDFL